MCLGLRTRLPQRLLVERNFVRLATGIASLPAPKVRERVVHPHRRVRDPAATQRIRMNLRTVVRSRKPQEGGVELPPAVAAAVEGEMIVRTTMMTTETIRMTRRKMTTRRKTTRTRKTKMNITKTPLTNKPVSSLS